MSGWREFGGSLAGSWGGQCPQILIETTNAEDITRVGPSERMKLIGWRDRVIFKLNGWRTTKRLSDVTFYLGYVIPLQFLLCSVLSSIPTSGRLFEGVCLELTSS